MSTKIKYSFNNFKEKIREERGDFSRPLLPPDAWVGRKSECNPYTVFPKMALQSFTGFGDLERHACNISVQFD
jgi:hypothetical protein